MTLTARADRYLAKRDSDDPLVRANAMVDEALAMQDAGRYEDADALLAEADALVSAAA